jgi:hypothetical protein
MTASFHILSCSFSIDITAQGGFLSQSWFCYYLLPTKNIVTYTLGARQRLLSKWIITVYTTSTATTEDRHFLCSPCQDVISRKSVLLAKGELWRESCSRVEAGRESSLPSEVITRLIQDETECMPQWSVHLCRFINCYCYLQLRNLTAQ